jgi:hypothetical protein
MRASERDPHGPAIDVFFHRAKILQKLLYQNTFFTIVSLAQDGGESA